MSGDIREGLQRPSDFRLGTTESRAAARAMAERRIKTFIRVKIIHIGERGSDSLPLPYRIQSEDCNIEFVHVGGDER
jgi:hypothetical protein